MILTLVIVLAIPEVFHPVSGFQDLDMTANPVRFGLLLVASDNMIANEEMADSIIAAVDKLPEESVTDLFVIGSDSPGYREIQTLCSDYSGLPAVLVLVGHCGYIQLNPAYLETEVLDSWFTWGNHDSRRTGICNFCRRCNP